MTKNKHLGNPCPIRHIVGELVDCLDVGVLGECLCVETHLRASLIEIADLIDTGDQCTDECLEYNHCKHKVLAVLIRISAGQGDKDV